MLRRAVTTALLAGLFATPATAAAIRGQTLMPGVVYARQVEFTPHGPVVVHILLTPKPVGGLYQLKPVLSNSAILGRERVTSMERSVSSIATVAGVNGDLFTLSDGHPSGALIRSGILDSTPSADRSSVGIDMDGNLRVERLAMVGTWKGTGQRRLLGVNQPASRRRTTLYTSAWGPRTPAERNAVSAILQPFPASAPNVDLTAPVTQLVPGGNQPIPPGGAVLVARADSQFLTQEAPVGTTMSIKLLLTPAWTNVTDALGGGPVIVRDGKPVFRSFELFDSARLAARTPRTGVGQTADGRILLVAGDGRQPGYSMGLTNFELALLMMRLGAVTASALDSGGSTTMAFDGKLLNRPSDPGGERAVAESLLLFYYGVYVPAIEEPVLSPNGDGTADSQALAYKVVRPSTVSAVLTGPGGTTIPIDSGPRAPGVQRFTWAGQTPVATPAPEGKWTFTVTAEDDQGRRSAAERQFSLNETLAFLSARARGLGVTASLKLTRPARLAFRIETPHGTVVRTLPGRTAEAGPVTASWRGRPGRYVFSVTATNEIGAVEQTVPFTLRRQ